MKINGKSFLVTGGAGFIGSSVVAQLLKEDVEKVVIYDNFTRGKMKNIDGSLKDSRCIIYPNGGDIRDVDILNDAIGSSFGKFTCCGQCIDSILV